MYPSCFSILNILTSVGTTIDLAQSTSQLPFFAPATNYEDIEQVPVLDNNAAITFDRFTLMFNNKEHETQFMRYLALKVQVYRRLILFCWLFFSLLRDPHSYVITRNSK